MKKGVCIISGGLDSCVAAYDMKKNLGLDDLILITFNYGQKHKKEIGYAQQIAKTLNCPWELIDFVMPKEAFNKSSLTSETKEIPEGYYAEENMRSTVVPNRNTIMLSFAWAYACGINASVLGCGAHAGDHFIYPDCRPDYFHHLEKAFKLGTELCSHPDLYLYVPLLDMHKSEVVKKGIDLGVPFTKTWTCYKGLDIPCGKCGSCDERINAFDTLGLKDPVRYAN